MPEPVTHEFWKGLQPISDCFKPDAKPEVYLRNAPIRDERLYVPFTETVKSCPLWILPSENRWYDILMAMSTGLVNRHYRPHEVFTYITSGKRGYLEHDWTTTADDFVYETSGEGHTLVVYEREQPMRAFFIVKGPLAWLGEKGNADDIFDVHDYIAMCRARYDKIGVGAAYIDSLFRWPRTHAAPADARLPADRPARPGNRRGV